MTNLYLELYNYSSGKIFKKYFECEYELFKFERKLRYSKKLKVIGRSI